MKSYNRIKIILQHINNKENEIKLNNNFLNIEYTKNEVINDNDNNENVHLMKWNG